MKHRSSKSSQRGGRKGSYNRREDRSQFQNRPSNNNSDHNRNNVRPIIQSILPSPEILQEYEYASEGTVARLLEMAEIEQDRRNQWENEYLRFHKKSLRIGQLFGFILTLSVIAGTVYLGSLGQDDVAIALAASGFFAVVLASLFSEIGRRLSRRPRRGDRR